MASVYFNENDALETEDDIPGLNRFFVSYPA